MTIPIPGKIRKTDSPKPHLFQGEVKFLTGGHSPRTARSNAPQPNR